MILSSFQSCTLDYRPTCPLFKSSCSKTPENPFIYLVIPFTISSSNLAPDFSLMGSFGAKKHSTFEVNSRWLLTVSVPTVLLRYNVASLSLNFFQEGHAQGISSQPALTEHLVYSCSKGEGNLGSFWILCFAVECQAWPNQRGCPCQRASFLGGTVKILTERGKAIAWEETQIKRKLPSKVPF